MKDYVGNTGDSRWVGRMDTLEEVINPDSTSTLNRYDEYGNLAQTEDERGALSTWNYDERGRVTSAKGPSSGWTYFSYGSASQHSLTTVQDAVGAVSTSTTDAVGRVVRVDRPDGTSVVSTYSGSLLKEVVQQDGAGAPIARKGFSYWTHDNRPQAEWGWHSGGTSASPSPSDYLVLSDWTDGGRQASVGTLSETTTFGYAADGQLEWEEWQAGFQRREIYRDEVEYVDGSEVFYKPWINAETLVGGISTPGGSGASFRDTALLRDDAGRLIERWVDDGYQDQTDEYTGFDAYDQPAQVRSLSGTTETVKHQWVYDQRGRPEHRATTLHSATVLDTDFSWYDNGALASYTTPSGAHVVYDRPDPLTHGGEDLLAGVAVGSGPGSLTSAVSVLARDPNNRATDFALPSSTLSLAFDLMGRVTSQSTTSAGGTNSWTRGFDDRGRIDVETVSTPSNTWSNHYVYDEPGWLVEEYRGNTGDLYEYTYDVDGRRQSVILNGVPQDALTWDAGQVTQVDGSVVSLDDWGAVVQDHLGYQYERSASGHANVISDGSGNVLYEFTRDASGLVIENYESSTGARINTWGLGLGGLPLEVEDATGATLAPIQIEGMLFASFDGSTLSDLVSLPSLSLAFDGGSPVEPGTAFGDGAFAAAGDFRFRFGGNEMLPDAPGVQLAQQRLYDEASGRFLRDDPIGLGGGVHRGRYVDGNPVSFSDPSGLFYDPNPIKTGAPNDIAKLWGGGSSDPKERDVGRVAGALSGWFSSFKAKRKPFFDTLFGRDVEGAEPAGVPDHNAADASTYSEYLDKAQEAYLDDPEFMSRLGPEGRSTAAALRARSDLTAALVRSVGDWSSVVDVPLHMHLDEQGRSVVSQLSVQNPFFGKGDMVAGVGLGLVSGFLMALEYELSGLLFFGPVSNAGGWLIGATVGASSNWLYRKSESLAGSRIAGMAQNAGALGGNLALTFVPMGEIGAISKSILRNAAEEGTERALVEVGEGVVEGAARETGELVAKNPYFIRYDPAIPGRPDPKYSVDTTMFREGTNTNAAGFPRDSKQFWSKWLDQGGHGIGDSNRYRIEELNVAPRVDSEWLHSFPEHQVFRGDRLFHHHVDQGRYAIPVPESSHVGSGGPWHGYAE